MAPMVISTNALAVMAAGLQLLQVLHVPLFANCIRQVRCLLGLGHNQEQRSMRLGKGDIVWRSAWSADAIRCARRHSNRLQVFLVASEPTLFE